jgi:hypothetical protein
MKLSLFRVTSAVNTKSSGFFCHSEAIPWFFVIDQHQMSDYDRAENKNIRNFNPGKQEFRNFFKTNGYDKTQKKPKAFKSKINSICMGTIKPHRGFGSTIWMYDFTTTAERQLFIYKLQ